jgi:hypothetical protein
MYRIEKVVESDSPIKMQAEFAMFLLLYNADEIGSTAPTIQLNTTRSTEI